MPDPIVIFQMQRMGDLILTFPLLSWLNRLFPEHRIYVAAEHTFFSGLLPFSPKALYVPWKSAEQLLGGQYRLVINLSHHPEAAELAGRLRAEQFIGPVRTPKNTTYIHGNWQLYRTALTQNNRHNAFHWADMNALDLVPLSLMKNTLWPPVRQCDASGEARRKIGLFLGASEQAKRPAPEFWAALAQELLRYGFRPLLLGGKAEAELGRAVAGLMKYPLPNFCGRFSLSEFAAFSSTLGLMITPDTGPMHLAAWLGLKTLNLSMGPVNPLETGPYPPGHLVLQSRKSCVGCWQCARPEMFCQRAFPARSVAAMARSLLSGEDEAALVKSLPLTLSLSRSARDPDGLYALERLAGQNAPETRQALTALWRNFFGAAFGLWPQSRLTESRGRLDAANPALNAKLDEQLAKMMRELTLVFRRGDFPLGEDFWSRRAPMLRPLSGYLQMMLQNADYSKTAFDTAVARMEMLKNSR